MKSLVFIAGATLLASPFACLASADEPPDFVELLEERHAKEVPDRGDVDDEVIERFMLVDPTFPYSELREPPSMLQDMWKSELEVVGIDAREGYRQIARRYGMTKSRPGIDVQLDPALGMYDPFVSAQITKAGVDPDIERQAIEHFRFHRSAIAANFAVAAQLLRDRIKRMDPADYEAAYILPDVLDRFMALSPTDEMTAFDGDYLESILSAETRAFRPDRKGGETVLPPQFRVARLAAAYHDRTGYFAMPPCLPSGGYHPNNASTGGNDDTRQLCLVDATDRAVHQWYLGQYQAQIEGIKRYPDDEPYTSGLQRLLRPIAIISEAVGIVSFIRFSTGMRLFNRGKVPAAAPERFRSKVNQIKCRRS
jgi:hypothetical protein